MMTESVVPNSREKTVVTAARPRISLGERVSLTPESGSGMRQRRQRRDSSKNEAKFPNRSFFKLVTLKADAGSDAATRCLHGHPGPVAPEGLYIFIFVQEKVEEQNKSTRGSLQDGWVTVWVPLIQTLKKIEAWYPSLLAPPLILDVDEAFGLKTFNCLEVILAKPFMNIADFGGSMACHYPGDARHQESYWLVALGGADGLVKVPVTRWDATEYFSADEKEGFTYAIHGGFCADEDVIMFDNAFFGLSDEEARVMSPAQRLVMQTGYEALQNAGVTKASAMGLRCGVYLGDSGCDWTQLFGHLAGPSRALGSAQGIGGSRLAHALGLRGPTLTVDTACSSSLVAIGVAHTALRKVSAEQVDPGVNPHVKMALAQGCNLLLSPRMYILYSGPHMLSPRGRCFTFDGTADGYARGEGCGSLTLKMSPDSEEAQLCLAMLIGSAVNQDGRSASMTAPNGPSQQQCIRIAVILIIRGKMTITMTLVIIVIIITIVIITTTTITLLLIIIIIITIFVIIINSIIIIIIIIISIIIIIIIIIITSIFQWLCFGLLHTLFSGVRMQGFWLQGAGAPGV
ncbi:Phthiocerol synthesis polyketide synthase type I PpsC [Symbiodinium microadriaticum]|uniref:Phthiocerol synthesis polyketide synthase type I PpsC n=1 Tax=Symbiodinium microadriaticum TaxID=2951 RepID=A0A1Q9CK35_SYMMI|nr:Phthiocerol synthesis polyketide synthase type I PpsC [Symbiodinium microadriaticum]